MTAKIRAPGDLGADGRGLHRRIAAWLVDLDLVLDPHEEALVGELCRTADRLATLRVALAAVDPGVDSVGWCRLSSEERQRGLAMARLISSLGLPSGVADDQPGAAAAGRTPRSRRAQKAAGARWAEGRWGGQGAA